MVCSKTQEKNIIKLTSPLNGLLLNVKGLQSPLHTNLLERVYKREEIHIIFYSFFLRLIFDDNSHHTSKCKFRKNTYLTI